MLGTYKLKHTLYPNYDNDLVDNKDEYCEEYGRIYRKGTIWNIVTKQEYCELQNYDDEEIEDFMENYCDFDYVAYMKNKDGVFMVINCLDDFEAIKTDATMIIYQFHMLSEGVIKISKAEYKEYKDFRNKYCLKRVKVLEKGIKCPKFQTILYKLGEYDYNKYYALSMDELNNFVSSKVDYFKGQLKAYEFQVKKTNEILENLKKSIEVKND